jgi:hypothetical protein
MCIRGGFPLLVGSFTRFVLLTAVTMTTAVGGTASAAQSAYLDPKTPSLRTRVCAST